MTTASAVTEICINILFGYFCVYFRGDDEAQEKFVNYLKVGPRWLKYRFVFFWIIIFGLWWQRAAYVCANAIHNCLDTGGVSTGDILIRTWLQTGIDASVNIFCPAEVFT